MGAVSSSRSPWSTGLGGGIGVFFISHRVFLTISSCLPQTFWPFEVSAIPICIHLESPDNRTGFLYPIYYVCVLYILYFCIYYKQLAYMTNEAEKSKMGSWQTGDPGGLRVQFQCEFKGLTTREPICGRSHLNPSLKVGGDRCCSSNTERRKGRLLSFSAFWSMFFAFGGLEEAHPHWEGQFASLSVQIQTLLSSRNTFTETPRECWTKYLGALWPRQVSTYN